MAEDLAQEIIHHWEQLKADRPVFDFHWQEIADLVLPNRNDYIVERTPGQKRMRKVFDSTPIWANDQFAAGVHSFLTSPTLPWFALWTEDDRLNAIPRVRAWLQMAADRMYRVFNSPRRNFASQAHELYLDIGSIGQGVMFTLDSARSDILFSTRSMKEVVLAEDDEDRLTTLIRDWKWTARQAVTHWGKAAGETVTKVFETNPEKKFQFLHAIRPRRNRDKQRADRMHMPFESAYIALDDKRIVDVGGFRECPFAAPRFSKASGETYGRGPGTVALPDIKMLNEMVKTVIKAAQKIVDPPLMLPDDGFVLPLSTVPGGKNFYRAGLRPTDRIAPIETKGNIPVGLDLINALRTAITRTFYVDLMRMPVDMQDPAASGKNVTATWVMRQRDQEFMQLSPMLARMQAEFLGVKIDRVFAMQWRKSVAMRFGPGAPFDPPPPELSGARLRTEYVSPIAMAQKSSELGAVDQLMQRQLTLRQIDPQSPLVLDSEGIMRLTARDLNAPAAALYTPEAMARQRQQAAEAQQLLNSHQAVATLTSGAKDATGAIKNLADAHAAAAGAANDQGQQEAA